MVVTLDVLKLSGWLNADAPLNIWPMFVTLDVSKLSDWLNADAPCRESKGGHTVRYEVWAWRWEGVGDRDARSAQGSARLPFGSMAREGAHVEHIAHGCDAGGVEAQRLVERRRTLPRVARRACGAVRGSGREAGGGGHRTTAAHAACRGGRDCRLVAGRGEERT